MRSFLAELFDFCLGAVRDPITKDVSSARLIALWLALVGVYIAVALVTVACIVALRARPGDAEFVKGLISAAAAAMLGAVIGSGAVALLTRQKSPDPEPEDSIVDEPDDRPHREEGP